MDRKWTSSETLCLNLYSCVLCTRLVALSTSFLMEIRQTLLRHIHAQFNKGFRGAWLAWLALQRCMAGRENALEVKVGEMFTITEIDCSAGYMDFLHEQGRLQPSAAEFMANITVGDATSLDVGAEAQAANVLAPDRMLICCFLDDLPLVWMVDPTGKKTSARKTIRVMLSLVREEL